MSNATEQLDVFITGAKPICFLLGKTGSGKTTLLTNWINGLNSHGEIINFEISEPLEISQLNQRLQEVLDIELPNFSSAEQLAHTIDKLEQLDKPILLIIDNAQNLPPLTLASLYQLACYQKPNAMNLHLIVVGHPELQQTISNFTDEYYERETITIEMPEEESHGAANDDNHNEEALEEAAEPPAPIAEVEVPSSGDPLCRTEPDLDDIIIPKDTLEENETDASHSENKPSLFKRHSIKIVSLIILVLLLIGLYFYENQLDESGSKLLIQNRTAVEQAPPKPVIQKPVVIKAKPAPKLAAKPKTVVKPKPVTKPKPIVKTKPVAKPIAKTTPAPKPAVKPKPVAVTKPYYTIQLIASPNQAAIKRFVKTHGLVGQAHIRTKQVHGRTFYEIDFGHYPTYSTAQQGVKAIPASVKKLVNPWIKRGDVRRET